MRVTGIDISDLHFRADDKCHEGYVSMTISREGDPVQVQFHCRAARPEDCPTTIVTRDLIKDALRQAYRMPGFRRGERRIELEIFQANVVPRIASV